MPRGLSFFFQSDQCYLLLFIFILLISISDFGLVSELRFFSEALKFSNPFSQKKLSKFDLLAISTKVPPLDIFR